MKTTSVTIRLDPETARILKELTRRSNGSKSRAIRQALHAQFKGAAEELGPTAWEVYSKLKIPPASGPRRDRARHAKRLVKEILLAKRRAGTL